LTPPQHKPPAAEFISRATVSATWVLRELLSGRISIAGSRLFYWPIVSIRPVRMKKSGPFALWFMMQSWVNCWKPD